MDSFSLFFIFIIGALLGGGISWALLRARIRSEQAISAERLCARQEQIDRLGLALKKANDDMDRLQRQLQGESERRSAAEEKNSRIPELRELLKARDSQLSDLQTENVQLKMQISELETRIADERKAIQEKLDLLDNARVCLSDAFKALSAEALEDNSQSFLEFAKSSLERFQAEARGDLKQRQKAIEDLVSPIRESLLRVDSQIQEIERSRREAYGGLHEQVRSLIDVQEKLHSETENLVRALRVPSVRGRWGEIQLKRVIEIAGMLPYCDFVEQKMVEGDTGYLRPDLIVHLPGEKDIVVDAKAPLQAYLEAMEAKDEDTRLRHLKGHARQVRGHIEKLSAKAYWRQFDSSPEFVVMFLPGENFFSAALEQDPGLIEAGARERVILATPTTLIALLRAVAYGWSQEKIAENAQAISSLGSELYGRLCVFIDHLSGMGKDLDRAIDGYNKAVGSLEGRVLPAARRFTGLGLTSKKEIPHISPIDRHSRPLQVPELSSEVQTDDRHD